MDSFFTKRLVGDIRGAMMGLRAFFGKLGHFTYAFVAIYTVEKHGINAALLMVSITDISMFVFSAVIACYDGFALDEATGDKAIESGKEADSPELKALKEKNEQLETKLDTLKKEIIDYKKRLGLPIEEAGEEKTLIEKEPVPVNYVVLPRSQNQVAHMPDTQKTDGEGSQTENFVVLHRNKQEKETAEIEMV